LPSCISCPGKKPRGGRGRCAGIARRPFERKRLRLIVIPFYAGAHGLSFLHRNNLIPLPAAHTPMKPSGIVMRPPTAQRTAPAR